MDEEPRQEILYGQVFESDGRWYCIQGAGSKSMATSPPLSTEMEAEDWLIGALETAQSQWPENVTVILERIDINDLNQKSEDSQA